MIKGARLKRNVLRVELVVRDEPKVSGSGKNIVIASTMGAKGTGIEYEGQEIYLIANAFIRNPERGKHHSRNNRDEG